MAVEHHSQIEKLGEYGILRDLGKERAHQEQYQFLLGAGEYNFQAQRPDIQEIDKILTMQTRATTPSLEIPAKFKIPTMEPGALHLDKFGMFAAKPENARSPKPAATVADENKPEQAAPGKKKPR